MTEISIWLLCLCTGALLLWGLSSKDRMLQFPFLAAATIALQILPQFLALQTIEHRLPPNSLYRPILMTFLSLLMTAAGYGMAGRVPVRHAHPRLNWNRLLIGALGLVVMSQVFTVFLRGLPVAMLESSQWTGLPVRYMFFIHGGRYGFALALVGYLVTRRHAIFLLLLPSAYLYIVPVLQGGRRTPTAIFAMMVLSACWFVRRLSLPRWLMAAGLVGFMLFTLNIGTYRAIMKSDKEDKLQQIQEVDLENSLSKDSMLRSGSIEMKNAVYIMEMTENSGRYDYGRLLYNYVIMYFVPRQLVGGDIKNALLFSPPNFEQRLKTEMHYSWPMGSCGTGIADAFFMFWYFGALFYVLMGYVMRRLWDSAMGGNTIGQVIYGVVLTMGLAVYNASVANFITPWLHMALFLGPVFLWAYIPSSPRRTPSRPGTPDLPAATSG